MREYLEMFKTLVVLGGLCGFPFLGVLTLYRWCKSGTRGTATRGGSGGWNGLMGGTSVSSAYLDGVFGMVLMDRWVI